FVSRQCTQSLEATQRVPSLSSQTERNAFGTEPEPKFTVAMFPCASRLLRPRLVAARMLPCRSMHSARTELSPSPFLSEKVVNFPPSKRVSPPSQPIQSVPPGPARKQRTRLLGNPFVSDKWDTWSPWIRVTPTPSTPTHNVPSS